MSNIPAVQDISAIEATLVQGDLSRLTPDQRLNYFKAVCESVGLNPLTKPFEYQTFQGKGYFNGRFRINHLPEKMMHSFLVISKQPKNVSHK